MEQLMSAGAAPAPKKPEPKAAVTEVEITPPNGLDLSEFGEGREGEVVSKWKMNGGKLCLVSIGGIPISQSTEEEESPDEGTPKDPDADQEAQEGEGKNSGDRFMKKFRPQPKRAF